MTRAARVDREDELRQLHAVAHGETRERILLVRAESGMGKSELLREFVERQGAALPLVVVEFKGGGLSLADMFFHICDTLGWARFPTLVDSIRRIVHPALVSVTGNLLIGQNDISIALGYRLPTPARNGTTPLKTWKC